MKRTFSTMGKLHNAYSKISKFLGFNRDPQGFSGDLYTFGCNEGKNYGSEVCETMNIPTKVVFDDFPDLNGYPITTISCEKCTAVVLNGKVLFNDNLMQDEHRSSPYREIKNLDGVKSLYCRSFQNETRIIALTETGQLYKCNIKYYTDKDFKYLIIETSDKIIGGSNQSEYNKFIHNEDFLEKMEDEVISFSADRHQAIIKDNSDKDNGTGTLYTKGTGGVFGELGHGSETDLVEFKQVEGLNGVKSVSCGKFYTAVITIESGVGKLFTFGMGEEGQLGHGKNDNLNIPRQVEGLNNFDVKFVSCGIFHTAVICLEDGKTKLFTFGKGNRGQLGHGDNRNYNSPKEVKELNNLGTITHVSCGAEFTAVIIDGKLYTFGANEFGQLGLGDYEDRNTPTEVKRVTKVETVCCGTNHIGIIASESDFNY